MDCHIRKLTLRGQARTLKDDMEVCPRMADLNFAQIMISILLFMILFFGIGFIANMLLRVTWVLAIVYPIIVILIIDKVNFWQYITGFKEAMVSLGHQIIGLQTVDAIILSSGFIGALASGVVIRILRKKGYDMF